MPSEFYFSEYFHKMKLTVQDLKLYFDYQSNRLSIQSISFSYCTYLSWKILNPSKINLIKLVKEILIFMSMTSNRNRAAE